MSESMFTRQHHNAIAKDIREELGIIVAEDYSHDQVTKMSVIYNLAVRLANRFIKSNPNFDPIKFLDACSPDTNLYPLSELWPQGDGK